MPLHNRLESLRGDRIGEQRIRTNQRWRICFTSPDAGPAALIQTGR